MPDDEVRVRRRRLPHWTLAGGTYFLTFRLRALPLDATERVLVRDHIVGGHTRYYDLAAVVVMPDHVHALLAPAAGVALPRVMQGIKGASARRLNEARGTTGPVWQAESFDRIVRGADEFAEKLGYMFNNPAKAGLVADGMGYDGWWCRPDLGQPPPSE